MIHLYNGQWRMKSYIEKHGEFIAYLAACTAKQAQTLIDISTDGELKAICEVALNYLNGRLKTVRIFDNRYNFLSNLASKSVSLDIKRHILVQSVCYTSVVQRLVQEVLE